MVRLHYRRHGAEAVPNRLLPNKRGGSVHNPNYNVGGPCLKPPTKLRPVYERHGLGTSRPKETGQPDPKTKLGHRKSNHSYYISPTPSFVSIPLEYVGLKENTGTIRPYPTRYDPETSLYGWKSIFSFLTKPHAKFRPNKTCYGWSERKTGRIRPYPAQAE